MQEKQTKFLFYALLILGLVSSSIGITLIESFFQDMYEFGPSNLDNPYRYTIDEIVFMRNIWVSILFVLVFSYIFFEALFQPTEIRKSIIIMLYFSMILVTLFFIALLLIFLQVWGALAVAANNSIWFYDGFWESENYRIHSASNWLIAGFLSLLGGWIVIISHRRKTRDRRAERCVDCGEPILANLKLEMRKCAFCEKFSHEKCYKFGFCQNHFKSLTLEKQEKVKTWHWRLNFNYYLIPILGMGLLIFREVTSPVIFYLILLLFLFLIYRAIPKYIHRKISNLGQERTIK